MVAPLAGTLAALAAVLATATVSVRADAEIQRAVSQLQRGNIARSAHSAMWRALASMGATSVMRRLTGRQRIADRLARSGWSRTPEEVAGLKALGAVVAGVGAALLADALILAPVAAIGGFLLPNVALARAARRRRSRADAAVPELLDLLAAGSLAGLAAPLALRRAAGAVRGPLGEELHVVITAVDLGGRWRDELRAMADRLDLSDLRRAVAAMARTERLGSSLSETLRELAADVRDARRSRATERARKAPVKMLFPLVFLVLPAFLLLTVVPVLLVTLRSIR
jgi:Flp pilus assembly protein TadB